MSRAKTPTSTRPPEPPAATAGVAPAIAGPAAPPAKTGKTGKAGRSAGAKPRNGRPKGAPSGGARAARAATPLYSPEEVAAIFHRFETIEPEPKGELEHVNPFTLLVAVVLSAQATDAGVNRATRALFAAADTPAKMLALGEDAVRDHIKTIGLFRNKAKNVIALSEALVRDHGGEVPADREALEALPGVGRKTANVVLNMAFRQPTFAVDTHIFRIGNRLGLAPGRTPLEVELAFEKIVPDRYRLHAHHWLILHGRYICKARRPECERCSIYDLCKSPEKRVVVG